MNSCSVFTGSPAFTTITYGPSTSFITGVKSFSASYGMCL